MSSVKFIVPTAVLVTIVTGMAQAQTWIGVGADPLAFNDPSNWNPTSVPSSGANIIVGSSAPIGMNTGGQFNFSSITVSDSISAQFLAEVSESLLIGSGGVTLGNGSSIDFLLPVQVTTTSTWNVGNGALSFSGATEISGTVNVSIADGGSLGLPRKNGRRVRRLS